LVPHHDAAPEAKNLATGRSSVDAVQFSSPRGRVRDRAARYWTALRVNLPFAWMFAYNAIVSVLLIGRGGAMHSTDELPGTGVLAERWTVVRDEMLDVLAERERIPTFGQLDAGQQRLSDDGRWRMFALRFYGVDVESNRLRCPRTAALLDAVPGVHTAMFSIMEPGKATPWHVGPFKGVMRYLLPLKMPARGSCGIKVLGGGRHEWHVGEPMVFDDTYPHKAWNHGDDVRVLLWMDVVRPFPWPWLNRVNRLLLWLVARTKRVRGVVETAGGFADRAT
jgi:aspartyl/asparaginyl beta-hydroxylase (cupin superfamily)